MTFWEVLSFQLNPPVIKKAEFPTDFISSELIKEFIKTAEALDVPWDEAIQNLKKLEDAYTKRKD